MPDQNIVIFPADPTRPIRALLIREPDLALEVAFALLSEIDRTREGQRCSPCQLSPARKASPPSS